MNYTEIQELIREHKKLSKELIDSSKYTYYASTYHSTTIEGSTLTESQVMNLIEIGKTAPNASFNGVWPL